MFSILLTLQKDHIRDAALGKTCVCINDQHKILNDNVSFVFYSDAATYFTQPNLITKLPSIIGEIIRNIAV